MSGSREIKITIVGDASRAKTAFQDTGAAATTFEGQVTGLSGKFANFGSVMSGVIAAGAVQKIAGFLKDGATGAMEDAAAMDRLKIAVQNTGTSFDSQATKIDAAIKKGQELAFSDGDITSALTNLTNATGDSDEALKRLSLAQDLARGTGMTLEQASKLLGKTSDENTSTLARYGVVLGENATAQDVMNEVDKRFGGQAAAFAESDAGKWSALQLQLTELQETIGGALIPAFSFLVEAFSTVMTAMEPVTSFIGENLTPIMIGLAAAITVIVIPAFVAWAIAAATAAAATIAAMLPIIAIAAAIGIAVAALYLAWSTNFLGIQDITKAVIDFVGPYITMAIDAIRIVFETVWPIISAIVDVAMQAIALYVTTYISIIQTIVETVLPLIEVVFRTVWDAIKVYVEGILVIINALISAGMFLMKDVIGPILGAIQVVFETVWGAIQTVIDTIAGPAGTLVNTVTNGVQGIYDAVTSKLDELKGYWDTFWNGLKGVVNEVIGAVKSAWNSVAGAINSGLSVWNNLGMNFDTHIPGVPNISWQSPDVPLLPTFGDSGYGGVGEKFTTQAPGGISGGPGGGGGTHLTGGIGTPGGTKPVDGGTTVVNPDGSVTYYPPTGNLSGGSASRGGGVGRGGGTQQAVIAAQLIAEGVPADEAIAAAKAAYDQKQAALQGAKATPTYQGGGYAGYGSPVRPGDAAYAAKHGAVMTSTGEYAHLQGAGGNVFLDGFRVGKFLGFRHRREAFAYRDPAGCN